MDFCGPYTYLEKKKRNTICFSNGTYLTHLKAEFINRTLKPKPFGYSLLLNMKRTSII